LSLSRRIGVAADYASGRGVCPKGGAVMVDWGKIVAEKDAEINRLRAGGCARDQGLTQYCAEAAALTAEVERLNKSRNKWGQKYNKLLEQHKVTLSQLKTAVWSDSEECAFLIARVAELEGALATVMGTRTHGMNMPWVERLKIGRAALTQPKGGE
jgi:hypothetical protein